MIASHELVVSGKTAYVSMEGVAEALAEVGYQQPLDEEASMFHAQLYLPDFTEAINSKLLLTGTYPQLQFADRRNEVPPSIRWGVVGVDRAAGTLAAMKALQVEATDAGYASEIAVPARIAVEHGFMPKAWFRFTVTSESIPEAKLTTV